MGDAEPTIAEMIRDMSDRVARLNESVDRIEHRLYGGSEPEQSVLTRLDRVETDVKSAERGVVWAFGTLLTGIAGAVALAVVELLMK